MIFVVQQRSGLESRDYIILLKMHVLAKLCTCLTQCIKTNSL